MEVKEGKFTINCERCGKSYDFLKEDVKFNPKEKMGEEEYYAWELKYNCLRCSNPISIEYIINVSSDGQIKDKKVNISGAEIALDTFEFGN